MEKQLKVRTRTVDPGDGDPMCRATDDLANNPAASPRPPIAVTTAVTTDAIGPVEAVVMSRSIAADDSEGSSRRTRLTCPSVPTADLCSPR